MKVLKLLKLVCVEPTAMQLAMLPTIFFGPKL